MKPLTYFGCLAGVIGGLSVSGPAFSQVPDISDHTGASGSAAPSNPGADEKPPRSDPAPSLRPQDGVNLGPKIPAYHGPKVVPGSNSGPEAWQPGGYSGRWGRPYYYRAPGRKRPLYSVHNVRGTPWSIDHSSYRYHFGPGYYRHSEGGHYRFPYSTYRAPWYFPGHPIYNRDTNRPW